MQGGSYFSFLLIALIFLFLFYLLKYVFISLYYDTLCDCVCYVNFLILEPHHPIDPGRSGLGFITFCFGELSFFFPFFLVLRSNSGIEKWEQSMVTGQHQMA
jgi:hypothetical protein